MIKKVWLEFECPYCEELNQIATTDDKCEGGICLNCFQFVRMNDLDIDREAQVYERKN